MSRKGENIYKRKDGRYEARYVKERDDNNRIIKYGFVYGKTYREAKIKKQLAIENMNEVRKNEKVLGKKTFSKSILKWLTTKLSIKDTTRYNYYCVIVSRIIPYFKNIKLRDFKEEHIIKFTNK